MATENEDIVSLSNGDITIWIDAESSVHIKCITNFGDPVELNAEEVNELCEVLERMAKKIT
jgi:hypothetical protein